MLASLITPSHILAPSAIDTKDLRAYEHDRQRVKRAADFVKTKASKKRATRCRCCDPVVQTQVQKRKGVTWSAVADSDCDAEDHVPSLSQYRGSAGGIVSPPREAEEVKLADLVKERKARRGNTGDFEVIPHLRTVIVLDDFDLALDEPWEHIESDESELEDTTASTTKTQKKGPSYAAVAAK